MSPLPLWLPLLCYSLPLFIPPCPSLTHSLPPPLFFCLRQSLPPCYPFPVIVGSARFPFSFSVSSLSSHLSLASAFPVSSLRVQRLICLILKGQLSLNKRYTHTNARARLETKQHIFKTLFSETISKIIHWHRNKRFH